jgi:hypothetical protein
MITPEWVKDENAWLHRQIMKLSCSVEIMEHANADLEECARYWKAKAEADSGDSPTPPTS